MARPAEMKAVFRCRERDSTRLLRSGPKSRMTVSLPDPPWWLNSKPSGDRQHLRGVSPPAPGCGETSQRPSIARVLRGAIPTLWKSRSYHPQTRWERLQQAPFARAVQLLSASERWLEDCFRYQHHYLASHDGQVDALHFSHGNHQLIDPLSSRDRNASNHFMNNP